MRISVSPETPMASRASIERSPRRRLGERRFELSRSNGSRPAHARDIRLPACTFASISSGERSLKTSLVVSGTSSSGSLSRPIACHAAGMRSRAVSIADLKTNLSAHLARVRSGEEIVIRDQRAPIAKIVPLSATEGISEDEVTLAAEGKVRLPKKKLPASFWKTSGPRVATNRALEILREDRDAR